MTLSGLLKEDRMNLRERIIEDIRDEKVFTAMAIYLWFDLLFCAALWYGKKIQRSDNWLAGCAVSLPFVTFVFTLFLVFHPVIAMRPGVIFSYLLGADLCLLAVAWMENKLQGFYLAAGGCVFFILSLWIAGRMTQDLLIWALGAALVFAVLHSAVPIIAARIARQTGTAWRIHLFPLLALLLTLIPIIKGIGGSWLIWPFILIFNLGVLVLAVFTVSTPAMLAAIIVTGILAFGWIISISVSAILSGFIFVKIPPTLFSLSGLGSEAI